jgi:hypothetical protein
MPLLHTTWQEGLLIWGCLCILGGCIGLGLGWLDSLSYHDEEEERR